MVEEIKTASIIEELLEKFCEKVFHEHWKQKTYRVRGSRLKLFSNVRKEEAHHICSVSFTKTWDRHEPALVMVVEEFAYSEFVDSDEYKMLFGDKPTTHILRDMWNSICEQHRHYDCVVNVCCAFACEGYSLVGVGSESGIFLRECCNRIQHLNSGMWKVVDVKITFDTTNGDSHVNLIRPIGMKESFETFIRRFDKVSGIRDVTVEALTVSEDLKTGRVYTYYSNEDEVFTEEFSLDIKSEEGRPKFYLNDDDGRYILIPEEGDTEEAYTLEGITKRLLAHLGNPSVVYYDIRCSELSVISAYGEIDWDSVVPAAREVATCTKLFDNSALYMVSPDGNTMLLLLRMDNGAWVRHCDTHSINY